MAEAACRLDAEQRAAVESQITETCRTRGWELHTVNCRTNHVHVVVSAGATPQIVRNQLKAWSTRRLKELDVHRHSLSKGPAEHRVRENWWTERGSQRFINDAASLEAAILYVRDGQVRPREYRPEA